MEEQSQQSVAAELRQAERFIIWCFLLLLPPFALSFLYKVELWNARAVLVGGSIPVLLILYVYARKRLIHFWEDTTMLSALLMLWIGACVVSLVIFYYLLTLNYFLGAQRRPEQAQLVSVDRGDQVISVEVTGQPIARFRFELGETRCGCSMESEQVLLYTGGIGLRFLKRQDWHRALDSIRCAGVPAASGITPDAG